MADISTYEELEIKIKKLEEEIRERKQTEKELLEQGERYRLLTENAKDMIYRMSLPDGRYEYVSSASKEIFGYSAEEFYNSPILIQKVIHPDWQNYFNEQWENLKAGIMPPFYEYQIINKAGQTRWLHQRNALIYDDIGKSVAIEGIVTDITDRKQTEENLRESEEKYRLLIENIPSVVWVTDEQGITTFISPNVKRVYGFSQDEIYEGKDSVWFKRVHPEDAEYVEKSFKKMFTDNQKFDIEYRIQRKDGKWIWVQDMAIMAYEKDDIKYAYGVFSDITDRRQAEEALRESEEKHIRSKKMEALGLLAGGVAHDLNNLLSGIVSYPELLLMDLPEGSKLRKPIQTILESGNRAADLVQDLLTVARGVAITKEPIKLNNLIRDYLTSLEFSKLSQLHPEISFQSNLDGDLLNISGSYVHIRKAIMNLVLNSSEAILNSGNVTISTTNRYLEKPITGFEDIKPGEYVVLAVSDDGEGILSDHFGRIFEPFFTKKFMGRSGTGLGLTVVWNVVQDHEGYIDMSSDENGTIFELYFPITREDLIEKDYSVSVEDYKGNGETVLVIDDVESQREISCTMLKKLGYKTRSVSSGEEAVEYLKEHHVDIILLDMIMDPGINGYETYKRIVKRNPDQKAVIISGFAETDEVKKTQKLGAGNYLKKPLTLQKMGLAITEELKRAPGRAKSTV